MIIGLPNLLNCRSEFYECIYRNWVPCRDGGANFQSGGHQQKRGTFWKKRAPTKGNLEAKINNVLDIGIIIPLHCGNISRDDFNISFYLYVI